MLASLLEYDCSLLHYMTVSAAQSVSSCIAVYLLLKLQEGGSDCQDSPQDGLCHKTPSMQGSPCHSEDEVKETICNQDSGGFTKGKKFSSSGPSVSEPQYLYCLKKRLEESYPIALYSDSNSHL